LPRFIAAAKLGDGGSGRSPRQPTAHSGPRTRAASATAAGIAAARVRRAVWGVRVTCRSAGPALRSRRARRGSARLIFEDMVQFIGRYILITGYSCFQTFDDFDCGLEADISRYQNLLQLIKYFFVYFRLACDRPGDFGKDV
jgi:hypothetical protein